MDTQDIIALAVVYLIIVASLGISLLAEKRKWNVDTRKIVHIGIGNFVFVWWAFSEQWIMLAFFAIPFAVILFFAMFKDNIIARSKLGDLSRNKGHKTGLFFYVLSIIALIVFFFFDHWEAASLGIIAMTYGDGFGSIIGKKFGKHKTINGKTLEGSVGVFFATTVMSFVVMGVYSFIASQGIANIDYVTSVPFWLVPPAIGLIASVVEMLSPGECDNIFIPLLCAGAAVLMGL